uniref:Putative ovule protein n=1 Tax=Solanum chacoense TaxID=4108 RepID=A0A0V0GZ23_SOLCH
MKHLFQHFQTKDFERLKYFFRIEVAQSRSGYFATKVCLRNSTERKCTQSHQEATHFPAFACAKVVQII